MRAPQSNDTAHRSRRSHSPNTADWSARGREVRRAFPARASRLRPGRSTTSGAIKPCLLALIERQTLEKQPRIARKDFLITHDPQPGPAVSQSRGPPSWERGLPACGKLAKAALRAPSAGKDARDPRKTATLARPPDRAGDCPQSGRISGSVGSPEITSGSRALPPAWSSMVWIWRSALNHRVPGTVRCHSFAGCRSKLIGRLRPPEIQRLARKH